MYADEGIIICISIIIRYKNHVSLKNVGFKLHNVITCKEQTVLESIKDAFEVEGYKIDLY